MRSLVKRATTNFAAVALAAVVSLGACASSTGTQPAPTETPVGASNVPPSAPVQFRFDSLDSRPVSSDAMLGKPTILVFVQTLELWSQAQLSYLIPMAKHDGTSVNYAMVFMQTRAQRELVEIYRQELHDPFPAALADEDAFYGTGPFGELKVPTTVLLDREGRIVWRASGRVAKSDEIRAAMHGL
jgi:hypothetical protein